MNRVTLSLLRAVARTAQPWLLAAGVLLYALGGGIAAYRGSLHDWSVYWIGQATVTLLQLSSFFLREYFDRASQPPFEQAARTRRVQRPSETAPKAGRTEVDPAAEEEPEVVIIPRVIFLQIAAATMTIAAVLTVLLYAQHRLNPPSFVFIGLAFLLGLAYAVPPFRLVYSGYGELVMAILVANLFPALAYVLQEGELNNLLAQLTFPITLLYLAAALARSLQGYLDDVKNNRRTMMARLGWQRGMTVHNALVAMAYLALAIAVLTGLPTRLAFPAFLSLPVGLFQIWQISSIANGAKPRWRLLAYTALATVGFTAYFINLALWTS